MPKLAKFEEYVAPWEDTDGGEDEDIDKPKLKKYLHGLLRDKERLQEKVTTVTEERDTLKADVDAKTREGEDETARLKREKKELEDQLAKKASEPNIETLRLEVALEKGLTAIQAKRLIGETKEDLEEDADALLESFGGTGNTDDDTDESLRRSPRRVTNPGDPNNTSGDDPYAGKSVDELFPVNAL